MIIVVGGTKGGTGKSTIVTNLAAINVGTGHDSLLVDADKQASASNWVAVREEHQDLRRVPCVQKFGGLALTNELKSLHAKYEHIFVDAGGYDSEELRASMLAADRLYIPVRPAQFDVWTLPNIIQIVQQSQMYNPGLTYFFVVNGAHTSPNVRDVEELVALLEDIPVCQTVIHNRRAFAKAPMAGMAVTEMLGKEYDRKAGDEMMSLYEEVMG